MEEIIIKNNQITTKTKYNKILKEAIKQVVNFFGNEKISFKIIFLKRRKDFDRAVGFKTKRWMVAHTTGDDIIYIFDRDVFNKVSKHKKEYFYSTLVHEITHIYTYQKLWFIYPIWLTEGLAYVVAKQLNEIRKYQRRDITKAHYDSEWFNNPAYSTSAHFVNYLIKKYGFNKLINLIKNLEEFEKKKSFNKKFKEIYGFSFSVIGKDFSNNFLPSRKKGKYFLQKIKPN
ncbi:MAG: basic secretory protein-like protein [archaeon]